MQFQTNWNIISAEDKINLLNLINPTLGKVAFNIPKTVDVRRTHLSFYKDIELVEIQNIIYPVDLLKKFSKIKFLAAHPTKMYFLSKNSEMYHLDWSPNAIIFKANQEGQLNLNADNVLEYLKFFTYFSTGNEDRLHIVESPENFKSVEKLSETEIKFLKNNVFPAELIEETDDEYFCQSTQFYDGSLNLVNNAIHKKNGELRLINTETIALNLDVIMEKVDFI